MFFAWQMKNLILPTFVWHFLFYKRSIYWDIQLTNNILSQMFLLQILFVAGLAAVIGLGRTFRFFFQRHKLRASIAFFGGIIVILYGWAFVGTILELYGFVLLFR